MHPPGNLPPTSPTIRAVLLKSIHAAHRQFRPHGNRSLRVSFTRSGLGVSQSRKSMANIIEVKDLKKSFAGMEAVRGISFSVEQGATFGFLGPNGAGKSTTIKMLTTLLRPTSGTIVIDGHDPTKDPHAVRRAIRHRLSGPVSRR